MGYYLAGFDVVGVDIEDQPDYPFDFVKADVLAFLSDYDLEDFDAYHASPPCHDHINMPGLVDHGTGNLLPRTRLALQHIGKPYVIENVEGAKKSMDHPVMLCGSMFDLGSGEYQLRRHRMFEFGYWEGIKQRNCRHTDAPVIGIYGRMGARNQAQKSRHNGKRVSTRLPIQMGHEAMGIDWMPKDRLTQAIPPAYTEYIGCRLKRSL